MCTYVRRHLHTAGVAWYSRHQSARAGCLARVNDRGSRNNSAVFVETRTDRERNDPISTRLRATILSTSLTALVALALPDAGYRGCEATLRVARSRETLEGPR